MTVQCSKKLSKERNKKRYMSFVNNWQLHLLFLIPFIYFMVFKYYPMLGAQIAFRNFKALDGIWGSEWVGMKYLVRFVTSYQFKRVLFNTLGISIYQLIAGFPFPIILALMLNTMRNERYKKIVQTTVYAPHFISMVVMCGMIIQFLSPRNGFINQIIVAIGFDPINFMAEPSLFSSIHVWSGVWQSAGYGSIIYLAALSAIDISLYESAHVDGANVIQRIWYIDLPGIMPTAIILLILNSGKVMNVGFQKVLLLQNDLNIRSSEIIDTFVYKVGLASTVPNFSYATAIGLFKSIVGICLILSVNKIAKKVSETSLW